MSANKQPLQNKKQLADSLKLRVLQAKAKLGAGFRYAEVFQYFFGDLDQSGKDRLSHIWRTQITDEKTTMQIEWLAEHKNQAPTFQTK